MVLRQRASSLGIEVIYASPNNRAQRTAKIINGKLRVQIKTASELSEWRKPSSLIGKPVEGDKGKAFDRALAEHRTDPTWKWEDEESFAEVKERIMRFLEERKQDKEEQILVVTHSFPLTVFLCVVLVGTDERPEVYGEIRENASTTNTGITVLKLNEETKRWKLVTWNDHAHLTDIASA